MRALEHMKALDAFDECLRAMYKAQVKLSALRDTPIDKFSVKALYEALDEFTDKQDALYGAIIKSQHEVVEVLESRKYADYKPTEKDLIDMADVSRPFDGDSADLLAKAIVIKNR